MTLFKLAIVPTLLFLAGSMTFSQADDKPCTPDDLVGRYVVVSGERDGVKEPDERIKGTIVTFSKDSVVVADKDKKELYSATYTLDSTKNPSTIIMTSRVESSAGVGKHLVALGISDELRKARWRGAGSGCDRRLLVGHVIDDGLIRHRRRERRGRRLAL